MLHIPSPKNFKCIQQYKAAGTFCDLEKGFDSVNYDILLPKLQYYGTQGTDKALYT
jgi:hypothetical protein